MTQHVFEWLRDIRKGDRVELVSCTDPFTELKTGSKGTFQKLVEIDGVGSQVHVDWDDGSNLMLVLDAGDDIRRIDE